MDKGKINRAYIQLIKNKKLRTSSSKYYFQVYSESGEVYLFTENDLKKAAERAKKNPEDVYPVQFVEPEPEIIEKEVIKVVEVKKPGLFSSLFNFLKNN